MSARTATRSDVKQTDQLSVLCERGSLNPSRPGSQLAQVQSSPCLAGLALAVIGCTPSLVLFLKERNLSGATFHPQTPTPAAHRATSVVPLPDASILGRAIRRTPLRPQSLRDPQTKATLSEAKSSERCGDTGSIQSAAFASAHSVNARRRLAAAIDTRAGNISPLAWHASSALSSPCAALTFGHPGQLHVWTVV